MARRCARLAWATPRGVVPLGASAIPRAAGPYTELNSSSFSVWDTCVLYRARWSVECTFASIKVRGFDLERTGITQPTRLERLFGLVILAWVSCLRVGVWLHAQVPVKVKAHGRSAMSLVRYGAERLCNALRWMLPESACLIKLLRTPFPMPDRV